MCALSTRALPRLTTLRKRILDGDLARSRLGVIGLVLSDVLDWIASERTLTIAPPNAARVVEACPDLITIRTFLVQVRIARNDLAGALEALEALGAYLPPLSKTPRHLLIRTQLLRDQGRYDDALRVLAENAEFLKDDPMARRERSDVEGWREAWRVEQPTDQLVDHDGVELVHADRAPLAHRLAVPGTGRAGIVAVHIAHL